jgi:hypothetical protein
MVYIHRYVVPHYFGLQQVKFGLGRKDIEIT